MNAELVPVASSVPALPVEPFDARELVGAFLAGRNAQTFAAYRADLEDFRGFLVRSSRLAPSASADEAARLLLSRGHGAANGVALAYRADLLERAFAAATVNRRLAALRSVVKLAGTLGIVPWKLEVAAVEAQGYRDTRGPGADGVRRMLDALDERLDAKARRDRALVRLLFDLALRRAEAVRLDLEDLDLEAGTVEVLGKKRTQKERLTLPASTRASLVDWLAVRGTAPGPLFVNFDRAGKGRRLTGRSVARVVEALGEKAKLSRAVRPHGLRHAAITEALERTNGNLRLVQRFSRHRDARVLAVYDDNRADLGGDVARLVAAAV